MKTLVSKESHTTVSRVVEYNNHKFKIVVENYNANWSVDIYIHTKNGDLAKIASREDIPGTEYVDYCSSAVVRLEGNLANVAAAEKYIKLVY